ncbi:DNA-3-methyladenine glycosylase [Patescibacteria group bacterium]|nr:DNA-3-methyladenine glycosylase [Patescibacteria group bacterium]
MAKILPQKFFNRPTLRVAEELLGKFLIRRIGAQTISAMITEVEAYVGPDDKASHALRGKTKRTEVMFGKAGYWYPYLIYGMYYCLNIVTEKKEYPAAILIRSVECVTGPGRVCRYFKIDKRFNAMPANKKTGLWIEDREVVTPSRAIKRGKRIGVDYAGKWKHKLWRLYIK